MIQEDLDYCYPLENGCQDLTKKVYYFFWVKFSFLITEEFMSDFYNSLDTTRPAKLIRYAVNLGLDCELALYLLNGPS